MMNDELINNLSISCNHSERTIRNYKNALRKYCEYYDLSLQEFLDESEEDEKNNVRWKYCRLRTKLIEYRHHLLEVYAWNTVRKEIMQSDNNVEFVKVTRNFPSTQICSNCKKKKRKHRWTRKS